MVMVMMMEEEKIQHVVSIDLTHIVLQNVDYIHEELLQPKLVKAVVSDLFYFHAETDGFPPAHILPPVIPVLISSDALTPVDDALTVAAPKVSVAPTLVDDMLVVAAPVVSAAPKVFVNATLAVSVSPSAFDDLFVDIASVIVIPTVFYALYPQDHFEH